jgi:hypothetical protein
MNKTDFSINGYQLVKFNVTFENKDFEWAWARIEANDRNEINVSIIENSFATDAPGNSNPPVEVLGGTFTLYDLGSPNNPVIFDFFA